VLTPYKKIALQNPWCGMTPRIVRNIPQLLEVIRERRDELDVPHLTIDAIAGLADGHTGKLLAPNATKGLGEISFPNLLRALGLGLALIIIVEDPKQVARVCHRWTKRKRPQRKPSAPPQLGASLTDRTSERVADSKENEDEA
jgi:hypothetical protein